MKQAIACLIALAMAGSAGLVTACGDDGDDDDTDGGVEVDDWYAFAVAVFGPDTGASYLVGTARLEDETLNLDGALEVDTAALFSAGDGMLFSGTYSEPILTRYAVGNDGSLTADGQLSFAASGIENTGFNPTQIQGVSATKAYFLGATQIVVWNPTGLEIVDTIEVPDLDRGDLAPALGPEAIRRGTEIVWTVTWSNTETGAVLAETALVVLDTTDDSVRVSTREGCSAAWGGQGDDGSLFYTQGAWTSALWWLTEGTDAPAPCMLKVAPGADTFDDAVIDLRDVVGVDGAIGTMANVRPGSALVRVFEEDSIEVTPETTASDLTFRASWSWRWIDLPSLDVAAVDGLPIAGSGEFYSFHLGDQFVIPTYPETEDSTTVYEVTGPEGTPEQVLFTPGNIYGAAKAR